MGNYIGPKLALDGSCGVAVSARDVHDLPLCGVRVDALPSRLCSIIPSSDHAIPLLRPEVPLSTSCPILDFEETKYISGDRRFVFVLFRPDRTALRDMSLFLPRCSSSFKSTVNPNPQHSSALTSPAQESHPKSHLNMLSSARRIRSGT